MEADRGAIPPPERDPIYWRIFVAPALLGLAQSSAPDLESGLKLVFLVGAITMLAAFLLILTIPEVSMEADLPEKNETSITALPLEG